MERLPAMEIAPFNAPRDELFVPAKRQLLARLKLCFLKRYDRLIASYHELSTRQDLSRAEIEAWRAKRRREFRQVAGVEIEQRDALAAGLKQIAETGNGSVECLLAALAADYTKGSSLALGGSGASGGRG
jgi:hypothetical protein